MATISDRISRTVEDLDKQANPNAVFKGVEFNGNYSACNNPGEWRQALGLQHISKIVKGCIEDAGNNRASNLGDYLVACKERQGIKGNEESHVERYLKGLLSKEIIVAGTPIDSNNYQLYINSPEVQAAILERIDAKLKELDPSKLEKYDPHLERKTRFVAALGAATLDKGIGVVSGFTQKAEENLARRTLQTGDLYRTREGEKVYEKMMKKAGSAATEAEKTAAKEAGKKAMREIEKEALTKFAERVPSKYASASAKGFANVAAEKVATTIAVKGAKTLAARSLLLMVAPLVPMIAPALLVWTTFEVGVDLVKGLQSACGSEKYNAEDSITGSVIKLARIDKGCAIAYNAVKNFKLSNLATWS